MKEVLLRKLKEKYSGVSEYVLTSVADHLSKGVKEESEIEGAIENLANSPFSVEAMASMLQVEGDRRATAATKTAETNLRSKYDFVEKGGHKEEKKEPKDKEPDKSNEKPDWVKDLYSKVDDLSKKKEEPEWLKGLVGKVEELNNKVVETEQKTIQQQRREGAMKKLKDVPKQFYKNIDFGSLENPDEMVSTILDDFKGFKKELEDNNTFINPPSKTSSKESLNKEFEAEAKAHAEKMVNQRKARDGNEG